MNLHYYNIIVKFKYTGFLNYIGVWMSEVVVTRNNQITLTSDVREKLGIKEGDRVVINTEGSRAVIEKRSKEFWDKAGDFLPENFDKVIAAIRSDSLERFKKLGIVK